MLKLIEIALAPVIAYILFASARTVSGRIGRHLPINAFTRFLYRAHKVRPPYTEAERRDWHAWFWPLFAFAVLAAIIWYSDPTH